MLVQVCAHICVDVGFLSRAQTGDATERLQYEPATAEDTVPATTPATDGTVSQNKFSAFQAQHITDSEGNLPAAAVDEACAAAAFGSTSESVSLAVAVAVAGGSTQSVSEVLPSAKVIFPAAQGVHSKSADVPAPFCV